MNRLRSAMRLFRFIIAGLLWLLIAVGIALRLSVRDWYYPIGLVFYMTPIPAMLLYAVLATFVLPKAVKNAEATNTSPDRKRGSSFRRINQILTVLFLAWTIYSEVQYRPSTSSPSSKKMMYWNVSHVQMGVPQLGAAIRAHGASVVGLVEADRAFRTVVDEWERELPGYEVVDSHFGGLIAVKGRVKGHQSLALSYNSYCEQYDLVIDGENLTVLIVDIASNPRLSRARPILKLKSIADSLSDRPVIIMGDFNTPDDSVWFDSFRPSLQNAFRSKGTGYAPTWPTPIPVLTLDQVWTNDRVTVSCCWHGLSVLSDHRPVLLDAEFSSTR